MTQPPQTPAPDSIEKIVAELRKAAQVERDRSWEGAPHGADEWKLDDWANRIERALPSLAQAEPHGHHHYQSQQASFCAADVEGLRLRTGASRRDCVTAMEGCRDATLAEKWLRYQGTSAAFPLPYRKLTISRQVFNDAVRLFVFASRIDLEDFLRRCDVEVEK